MKFVSALAFLVASATSSAYALQGNYLSQLAGPSTATSVPSSFFPAPSNTVGQTGGMESFYSSGPPRSRSNTADGFAASASDTISPAFGLSRSTSSSSASAVTPSQQMLDAWSAQVSVELSASQLYLSASIWCRTNGYPGMAAWMLEESGEERGHGLAILEWALQQGWSSQIVLEPLAAPKRDWNSVVEVWQSILQAEQTNTQNLLRLASYANDCGDYGSQAFLNPFHTEQIDAEDKVGSILHKVANASPQFLVELDHRLGEEAEEEEHGH